MPILRVIAEVDDHHRLQATVPDSITPGKVEILLVVDDKIQDEADDSWMAGVAREWHDELSDPREDIWAQPVVRWVCSGC